MQLHHNYDRNSQFHHTYHHTIHTPHNKFNITMGVTCRNIRNVTASLSRRHRSILCRRLCLTSPRQNHSSLWHHVVNPKPARDRNAWVISFVMIETFECCPDLRKFDQESLLSLDLTQVYILTLELLNIHVIPRMVSEVVVVTSKAEAFPKASPAALQVDVPMASMTSTVSGLGVGEELKNTVSIRAWGRRINRHQEVMNLLRRTKGREDILHKVR
jgi:hypothetical protein